MESELKELYTSAVKGDLLSTSRYDNIHEIPKLVKVVINSGIKATDERNWINFIQSTISSIACQASVITKAKKSISNFKLREGMPIGVKVTLRGDAMYHFLYKFINIVLPRVRDFRGVPSSFDGNGNYTLGIKDYTIFPEVTTDSSAGKVFGMDITVVTSAQSNSDAYELLKRLGMPFKKAVSN